MTNLFSSLKKENLIKNNNSNSNFLMNKEDKSTIILNKTRKISSNTRKLSKISSNINWFRERKNEKYIEDSINQLLPEITSNKKEVIPINYFFNKEMIDKVMKLKEIFLEFDKDNSRKLELNELLDMFKTNNIPVEMTNLNQLFFDKKVIKKEGCLKFYELIKFIFNPSNEKKFKVFIENLKEDHYKNTGKQVFLPISFNLLLDYLNKRSFIRTNYEDIKQISYFIKEFLKDNNSFIESQIEIENCPVERRIEFHENLKLELAFQSFKSILEIFNSKNSKINKSSNKNKEKEKDEGK